MWTTTVSKSHSSQEMLVASLGEEAAAKVSVWNKDDG